MNEATLRGTICHARAVPVLRNQNGSKNWNQHWTEFSKKTVRQLDSRSNPPLVFDIRAVGTLLSSLGFGIRGCRSHPPRDQYNKGNDPHAMVYRDVSSSARFGYWWTLFRHASRKHVRMNNMFNVCRCCDPQLITGSQTTYVPVCNSKSSNTTGTTVRENYWNGTRIDVSLYSLQILRSWFRPDS